MRAIAIILGLALAAVAVAYWVVPAGSLPGFFPGFEAGSDHVHMKHGLAAAGGEISPVDNMRGEAGQVAFQCQLRPRDVLRDGLN